MERICRTISALRPTAIDVATVQVTMFDEATIEVANICVAAFDTSGIVTYPFLLIGMALSQRKLLL